MKKEGMEEEKGMLFKSAEVASIAGIDVSDIILGKSSNDVCKLYMYTHVYSTTLNMCIYLKTYVAIHHVCVADASHLLRNSCPKH